MSSINNPEKKRNIHELIMEISKDALNTKKTYFWGTGVKKKTEEGLG